MRILAEDFLYLLLHLRHTGHTADQDDFVDFRGIKTGILQSRPAGTDSAFDQVIDKRLELGAAQFDVPMFGA